MSKVLVGAIMMNKYAKMVLFGFILWLVPFITGFLFVDRSGNFLIPETFFKSIMIVEGSLIGVILAVRYFRDINVDHIKEGIILGMVWLVINLALDMGMVFAGFFPLSVVQYFTDIGLRYLTMPIYTIGLGLALEGK